MNIKSYFANWSLFEKLYLAIGIIISIITTILSKGSIINALYTITYLCNALLSAKGKVESYIFGFTGVIFYGYLSFNQKYYGELLILIFMSIPIMIYGLFEWFRNQDKEEKNIIINTLSKKEIILAISSQVILFWVYYFLLKAFNTALLIPSSLSIVCSLLALYFGARRSELSYYFYILNDFVVVSLWLIPVINGNTALVSVLVGPLLFFINDFYGVINWKRLKHNQKERGIVNA